MDALCDALLTVKFTPGEVRLNCITEELKSQGLSTKQFYNADGVIIDDVFNLQLTVLKTSGPYGLDDDKREAKDYIKAAYGLLVMLHAAAKKFRYSDVEIFKKYNVYFIQAAVTNL